MMILLCIMVHYVVRASILLFFLFLANLQSTLQIEQYVNML
jgi:hypothetical protein